MNLVIRDLNMVFENQPRFSYVAILVLLSFKNLVNSRDLFLTLVAFHKIILIFEELIAINLLYHSNRTIALTLSIMYLQGMKWICIKSRILRIRSMSSFLKSEI